MTTIAGAKRDHTDVLIVDDHRMVGETLGTLLEFNGLATVAASGSTVSDILAEAREVQPRVVVLDLELGDSLNGRDLIRPLIEMGVRVLVLSGTADQIDAAECFDAGAIGVASKAEPFPSVLDKIRAAADGSPVASVSERTRCRIELEEQRRLEQKRRAPLEMLSPREQTVLAEIVEGKTVAVIARDSFVSIATVRTQVHSILQKLGVNSQLAACALARRHGWFESIPGRRQQGTR